MYLKQLSLLRCAFLLCVFVCVCVCVCVFVCVCLCVRLHMNLCSYMNLHFKFKMAFYWVFAYCISMIWISLDLTLFREKALKMFKSSLTEGGEFDAMMLVITMTITWHVSHTVPNCIVLHFIAMYCTTVYCTVLYFTTLYYIVLHQLVVWASLLSILCHRYLHGMRGVWLPLSIRIWYGMHVTRSCVGESDSWSIDAKEYFFRGRLTWLS